MVEIIDSVEEIGLEDLIESERHADVWWDDGIFKLWDKHSAQVTLYFRFEDYNGPDQYMAVCKNNTGRGTFRLEPNDLPWECDVREVVTRDTEEKYSLTVATDYGENDEERVLGVGRQQMDVDIEDYEWTPPTPPKHPDDARFDDHNPQNHR
ncbi:hypothetical protein [Natronolimnobius baerhuensis]|uniref:Uncharacterized protein n=1 Tax=Natronolimnobius baerhuensis TaxID=253108 RepID=A0A202EA04_9EURY|nr:hypothetical protein [Natronolimnobius baerhuensis]OVE85085.1 hypothetical protein B2G88_12120 [Natronolimnobius baerhuensis]